MYRKNSVLSSVYDELVKVMIGGCSIISIVDFKGDKVGTSTIRMAISKISSDKKMEFVTRVNDAGLMVWRIK